MIGILLALQVNNWNENRLSRMEEREAISRLIVDLEIELSGLDGHIKRANRKLEGLSRVEQVLFEGTVVDTRSFLEDVTWGSFFGWNQGDISRSTYDDLVESGNFGVIRSPEVRTQISAYYDTAETNQDRMKSRQTPYPDITYQLIPRQVGHFTELRAIGDTDLRLELTDEQLRSNAESVLESDIRHYVTAEQNLGLFVREFWIVLQLEAGDLVEVLKEYQKEIE